MFFETEEKAVEEKVIAISPGMEETAARTSEIIPTQRRGLERAANPT